MSETKQAWLMLVFGLIGISFILVVIARQPEPARVEQPTSTPVVTWQQKAQMEADAKYRRELHSREVVNQAISRAMERDCKRYPTQFC